MIKSSAFLRVEHPFAWKFEVQIFLTCLQLSLVGTLGKNFFRNLVPDLLTCPQLCPLGANKVAEIIPHLSLFAELGLPKLVGSLTPNNPNV